MTHTTYPPEPATELLAPRTAVHWVCFGDCGQYGIGSADVATSFDEACDQFVEFMRTGSPARVYQLDFTAGTVRDVTTDVQSRVIEWCNMRHQDAPDYCLI